MFCLGWFLSPFLGLKSQDDHSLLRYPRSPSLQPSRDARQHQHVCFKGTGGLGEDDVYGREAPPTDKPGSQPGSVIELRDWSWPVRLADREETAARFSVFAELFRVVCILTWWATTAADWNWSLLFSLSQSARATTHTRLFCKSHFRGYKISLLHFLMEMSNTVYTSVLSDALTSFTSWSWSLLKNIWDAYCFTGPCTVH